MPSVFSHVRIAIRGGGDLGSGVAFRLAKLGFPVLITELPAPLLVRRAVSFGSAIIDNSITIEGITGRQVKDLQEILACQAVGEIAVIADPEGAILPAYQPSAIIDARMRKTDPGNQRITDAMVIGLGPGFVAPQNCDAVIETNRGHNLGRAIYEGDAEPDTGQPGEMMGQTHSRVLRSPVAGIVKARVALGASVQSGQSIALIGSQELIAPFDGVLRGLVHEGQWVDENMKIGDLDPRCEPEYCFTISDKSLAIGGGVLEAVLSNPRIQQQIVMGQP